ncbi:hypothetical protein FB451DRAFT_503011 [Mycena latifolia]|nr:hypothetical protein FB451DRAFT_503011 [Mycena latifolia]
MKAICCRVLHSRMLSVLLIYLAAVGNHSDFKCPTSKTQLVRIKGQKNLLVPPRPTVLISSKMISRLLSLPRHVEATHENANIINDYNYLVYIIIPVPRLPGDARAGYGGAESITSFSFH